MFTMKTLSVMCLVGSVCAFSVPSAPRTSVRSRDASALSMVALPDWSHGDANLSLVAAVTAFVAFANMDDEGEGDSTASLSGSSTESGSSTSSSSGGKADVSIPYQAAARLAYQEWKSTTNGRASFSTFNEIFERKAAAEATYKKVAREQELVLKKYEAAVKKAEDELAALAK